MTSAHLRLTECLKSRLQRKLKEVAQLKDDIENDEQTLHLALQEVSGLYPVLSHANAPWFEQDDQLLAAIKECPWDLDTQQIAILLGRTTEEAEKRLQDEQVMMLREVARLAWHPMRARAWIARIAERELAELKKSFALHLLSSSVMGCPSGYVVPHWADSEEALLACAGVFLR